MAMKIKTLSPGTTSKPGTSLGSAIEKAQKQGKKRSEASREMRKEASRLASMANKRLKRLENNGLQNTPAYEKYLREGGEYFGVRGKTDKEVRKEVVRMKNFINSKTSTIRGLNSTLKTMAKATKIKYRNMNDLMEKSNQFFRLAALIEDYLDTVENMAAAIGYQEIWEAINEYVEREKINLADANQNIEAYVDQIAKTLKQYDPYEVKDTNITTGFAWFKLEEDDDGN